MKPLFSIIMCTYNRAEFLPASIGSVLNQTYKNFELVIIDDGSKDDTERVVKKINDQRITYIYNENSGKSTARNRGIRIAKGKYICFLDDDDEYIANHLQVIKAWLTKNNFPAAFIYTLGYKVVNGKKVKELNLTKNELTFPDCPPLCAICIPCSIAKKYKFKHDLVIWQDTECFNRIISNHPVHRIKEYTILYHKHDANSTIRSKKYFEEIKRTVYYYIWSRKKMSLKIAEKLQWIYYSLFNIYFEEGKIAKPVYYFVMCILVTPWQFYGRRQRSMLKKLITGGSKERETT